MDALSYVLRSKENWWIKWKDAAIAKKWIQEAVEQGLTEHQAKYVIDELGDFSKLRDERTGIQVLLFVRS